MRKLRISNFIETISKTTGSTKIMVTIAVVAVLAGILIVTSSGNGGNHLFSSNVTVTFGSHEITVHAELPGPMTTTYYYYYYYYARPVPSENVTVIVVAERLERGIPTLTRFATANAMAYTSSHNWVDVDFKGLEPGVYRVKVYYWNGLLSELNSSPWKPLGMPYTVLGSVS